MCIKSWSCGISTQANRKTSVAKKHTRQSTVLQFFCLYAFEFKTAGSHNRKIQRLKRNRSAHLYLTVQKLNYIMFKVINLN